MEAVIGLFLIVGIVAVLTGAGRDGVDGGRTVTRSDSGSRATAISSEGGSSGILPVMILLITIVALVFNAG